MTLEQITTLVNSGGVVFLLLVVLYGGLKGMWVFGRIHEAALVRENEWKTLALRLLPLAEKATAVAEVVVVKNGTPP